jgi:hypothetical protein
MIVCNSYEPINQNWSLPLIEWNQMTFKEQESSQCPLYSWTHRNTPKWKPSWWQRWQTTLCQCLHVRMPTIVIVTISLYTTEDSKILSFFHLFGSVNIFNNLQTSIISSCCGASSGLEPAQICWETVLGVGVAGRQRFWFKTGLHSYIFNGFQKLLILEKKISTNPVVYLFAIWANVYTCKLG